MNSFQINSLNLTEAGSARSSAAWTPGARCTCATKWGSSVYVDVATGSMIHENTVGSIRFRTDSTGTVMEHLL